MKKISILSFAILISILTVNSCVQPFEPGFQEDSSTHQLELKVSCLSPATKAFENYPDGENALNENRIDHVDWFIFRDTVGTDAIPWASDRVVFSGDDEIADGTTEFKVAKMGMDKYLASYSDGKGYVLAIANYPSDDHSVYQTNDGAPLTFSQIREMQVVTSELGALANGTFTALNDFLMTSYATPFTLSEGTTVTVNAKLSRLAAKISLNISIVPYIDEMRAHVSGLDTNWVEYIQTWYPNVEGIRAYMTYANERTSLTPVTDQTDKELIADYNDDDFFTYNSRGFVIDPVTTTGDGTSIVTGSPFYSYPMKWETSDPHAPFIKIILQWTGYKEQSESITSSFISHETGGTHTGNDVKVTEHEKNGELVTKSQNFYYKISIPSKENILQSNVWTKISLDVAVLGGVDEDNTVNVVGRYYVVDWNDPRVEGGGELTSGCYFNIVGNSFDMYGNTLQIPVSASGSIKVTAFGADNNNPTATYPLGTSTNTGSLTYSTTSSTGTNFMVTPAANATYVQIDHEVLPFSTNFSASNGNAKDVAKITYQFRVSLVGHPDLYKDITVTQYPSIYMIRQESRGYPFVNSYYNNTASNNNDYNLGPINNDAGSRSSYFTIVSISTLSGLSSTYPDWVIGDPRIKLKDVYITPATGQPYYVDNNNATNQWLRNDLGEAPDYFDNYMVGNKTASNVIAPKFMLASGFGYRSSLTNSNWKSNSERCATYQEDGYPAGRWRLPTEAELLFCATLASHSLIESPFVNNTNYWATSGRYLPYNANNTNWSFTPGANNSQYPVRCVYDVWYWGDEPVVTPGNYSVMLPE
jgi:hypothetical protein